MKTKIILASLIAAALFLTGCDKKTPDPDIQLMLDVAKTTEAVNKTMTGGYTGASMPLPEVPKPPQKKSSADIKTPLDRYVLLDTDDKERAFLYLYAALGGKFNGGDEELLSMVSARYYNERDAFKRKDIEAAEKPRVAAEIERYRQIRYIAFNLSGLSIAPYDFDKKGFGVTTSRDCADTTWRTGSGLYLKSFNEPGTCLGFSRFLVVKDDVIAKSVEGLRANNDLFIKTIVYAYAEEAADGQILITPTAIRLQIFNRTQYYRQNQDQLKPVADLIAQK